MAHYDSGEKEGGTKRLWALIICLRRPVLWVPKDPKVDTSR